MSATMLSLRRQSLASPMLRAGLSDAKAMSTQARVGRRGVTKRSHFLTVPIYESPAVVSNLERLRDVFRGGAGQAALEPDIIVPDLHHSLSIKLGNINVKGAATGPITRRIQAEAPAEGEAPPEFELERVLEVLHELRDPIRQLLVANGQSDLLRVPMGQIVPLRHGRVENFNPRKVNVLFLHPSAGPGQAALEGISKLVHEKFGAAGMLVGNPPDPARLNMTLINTANRPNYVPAPGVSRKPFNLRALYELEGFKAFRPAGAGELPTDLVQPLEVELGTAEIDKIYLEPAVVAEGKAIVADGAVSFV